MALTPAPQVLVVAGSDSSGGAGVVRDIETLTAFGVKASLALTAVTVQTHEAVERLTLMPGATIAAQMRAALSANPVSAVKSGMLGSADAVHALTAVLETHPGLPLVLDPVLAASSGRALLPEEAIAPLISLMRRARLVTPNLPELALLSGRPQAGTQAELREQAARLIDRGVPALLVKGGHFEGEGAETPAGALRRAQGAVPGDDCIDMLFRPGQPPLPFRAPRLKVTMRGTGCALASAIAAGLAKGEGLEEAIAAARRWLHARLEEAMEG